MGFLLGSINFFAKKMQGATAHFGQHKALSVAGRARTGCLEGRAIRAVACPYVACSSGVRCAPATAANGAHNIWQARVEAGARSCRLAPKVTHGQARGRVATGK
jgi:hypothetical protein